MIGDKAFKRIFTASGQAEPCQELFDELVFQALKYRYGKSGLCAVKIDIAKDLTTAIFGLGKHDQLTIFGETVDGHKFKEVFITSIFFPFILSKVSTKEKDVHLVISVEENDPVDTAIMVVPLDGYTSKGEGAARLDEKKGGVVFRCQVKELYDHKATIAQGITVATSPDIAVIAELARMYPTEFILLYNRDFSMYDSTLFDQFDSLARDRIVLIGSLYEATRPPEDGGETIPVDPSKLNFIVLHSGRTIHIQFKRPSCLIV